MTPENQAIATALGAVDAASHRSRQLTVPQLGAADLVLALTRQHRSEVVSLLPAASHYTFTLLEFARLARTLPAAARAWWAPFTDPRSRSQAAVLAVARSRGGVPPLPDPAAEDVVDPFRQNEAVYFHQASQIVPAVNAAVALLGDTLSGRR